MLKIMVHLQMLFTSRKKTPQQDPIGKRNPTDKALSSCLDISPELKPTLKWIAGLHQVWRYITMYTILTKEEIPEQGG